MTMTVLRPREASIFASLTDAVVSPAPPLPAVADTDAVVAFDAWLARAPRAHRAVLRAGLYALELAPRGRAGGRLRALDRERRLAFLGAAARSRVPGAAQVTKALRAAAALSYYGDADVMRILGYDADERVRGRAAREAAMRPELVRAEGVGR
jgi:hypothetical protein